jgi:hypothetical protein
LFKRATTQGGWIGLVVILVALVIVAMLSQSALRRYGLLGSAGTAAVARPGADAALPRGAASPPSTPIERARGVEDVVKRGAEDNARRIDDQVK